MVVNPRVTKKRHSDLEKELDILVSEYDLSAKTTVNEPGVAIEGHLTNRHYLLRFQESLLTKICVRMDSLKKRNPKVVYQVQHRQNDCILSAAVILNE